MGDAATELRLHGVSVDPAKEFYFYPKSSGMSLKCSQREEHMV